MQLLWAEEEPVGKALSLLIIIGAAAAGGELPRPGLSHLQVVLLVLIVLKNALGLVVGLRAISGRRLIGLPVLAGFHGLADFFENWRDGRIGAAGGVVGDLVGFLLRFHGNLLGLRRVLMGFANGGILLGLLHRLVEALLFFRGELDHRARVAVSALGVVVGLDIGLAGAFDWRACLVGIGIWTGSVLGG